MKIYTKTGDQGQTGLIGGARVDKDDQRIELYGTIDELNSFIGLITSEKIDKEINEFLQNMQVQLFNLASNLACLKSERAKFKLKNLDSSIVETIEKNIDYLDWSLEPLKNFILPGGSRTSSLSHVARTICRKCERRMITFEKACPEEKVENAVIFLNRLSDYFFTLARYFNKSQNIKDVLWS